MSTEHLVRMANQISANVPDREAPATQTAAHLASFWTPAMIDNLAQRVEAQPEAVTPGVRAALAILRPGATPT